MVYGFPEAVPTSTIIEGCQRLDILIQSRNLPQLLPLPSRLVTQVHVTAGTSPMLQYKKQKKHRHKGGDSASRNSIEHLLFRA